MRKLKSEDGGALGLGGFVGAAEGSYGGVDEPADGANGVAGGGGYFLVGEAGFEFELDDRLLIRREMGD